jgi:hypothetical protein
MGVTRKSLSVLSFGLINFRSAKERQARYARQSRNEQRLMSRTLLETARRMEERERRQ